MATVTREIFRSTGFLPTPAEIEAHTAEFKQRKLEEIANRPDPAEAERRIRREKLRQKRKARREALDAKVEARRLQSYAGDAADDYQPKYRVPVPPGGPREMTKADIANVEFIDARDMDSVLDDVIDVVSFQHALEDCECRWNVADVDLEIMDLSDSPPFKGETQFKPKSGLRVVG